MPPVRYVICAPDLVEFLDHKGVVRTLTPAKIPGGLTIAQAENYVNTVWIPDNIEGYQMVIHIHSLVPLSVAVMTANMGEVIPVDWWLH